MRHQIFFRHLIRNESGSLRAHRDIYSFLSGAYAFERFKSIFGTPSDPPAVESEYVPHYVLRSSVEKVGGPTLAPTARRVIIHCSCLESLGYSASVFKRQAFEAHIVRSFVCKTHES